MLRVQVRIRFKFGVKRSKNVTRYQVSSLVSSAVYAQLVSSASSAVYEYVVRPRSRRSRIMARPYRMLGFQQIPVVVALHFWKPNSSCPDQKSGRCCCMIRLFGHFFRARISKGIRVSIRSSSYQDRDRYLRPKMKIQDEDPRSKMKIVSTSHQICIKMKIASRSCLNMVPGISRSYQDQEPRTPRIGAESTIKKQE